jgi:hypothetical protein
MSNTRRHTDKVLAVSITYCLQVPSIATVASPAKKLWEQSSTVRIRRSLRLITLLNCYRSGSTFNS